MPHFVDHKVQNHQQTYYKIKGENTLHAKNKAAGNKFYFNFSIPIMNSSTRLLSLESSSKTYKLLV